MGELYLSSELNTFQQALVAAQRVYPVTLARVSDAVTAIRRGADVMNAVQVFREIFKAALIPLWGTRGTRHGRPTARMTDGAESCCD